MSQGTCPRDSHGEQSAVTPETLKAIGAGMDARIQLMSEYM